MYCTQLTGLEGRVGGGRSVVGGSVSGGGEVIVGETEKDIN